MASAAPAAAAWLGSGLSREQPGSLTPCYVPPKLVKIFWNVDESSNNRPCCRFLKRRHMSDPRTPGHRFATLYDTAKRCLLVLDQLYSELGTNLEKLAEHNQTALESQITVKLYSGIFSIIDFAHRFIQIIDSMPLLSKKQSEVKKLYEDTRGVVLCRNYVQHIRNHLSKTESINFPILGSISWIHKNKNYVLFPTQLTERYEMAGIAYDLKEMKYVCNYQFTIGTQTIALDPLYNAMKVFWGWLSGVAHITPTEVMNYEWGRPNIIVSEFSSDPNVS